MAVTRTPSDAMAVIPALCDLVPLKMRLQAGMVYLQHNWRAEERFAKGRERLLSIAYNEYLPRLQQMVADVGRETIEAQRDILQERLNRGWEVQSERVDELFTELLSQFEVLEDALRLEDPLSSLHPWTVLHARINEIATVRETVA